MQNPFDNDPVLRAAEHAIWVCCAILLAVCAVFWLEVTGYGLAFVDWLAGAIL